MAETMPFEEIDDCQIPSDGSIVAHLRAMIPSVMRYCDVPGLNIAIGRRGRSVWQGAFGWSNAVGRVPMTVGTVFKSGSIAKPYLAIAILQLVERGLLHLDSLVNDILPFEVQNPLGGPALTVHHLLTHTSGLVNNCASSFLTYDPQHRRTLARVVEEAYRFQVGQPPVGYVLKPMWTSPTGAQYQYSNLGSATLGLIVEVTNPLGLSYAEYVQTQIIEVLGMKSSQMPIVQCDEFVPESLMKRMSTGYQTMGGAWIPTLEVAFGEYPCGGSFTTALDFLQLVLSMIGNGRVGSAQILEAESVAKILAPASGEFVNLAMPSTDCPGLIWRLREWDAPHRSFRHAGGHMYGWQTLAVGLPDLDAAYVLAVNHWNSVGGFHYEIDEISRQIEVLLRGDGERRKETPSNDLRDASPSHLARSSPDPWQLSYLRGLLYAESYHFSLGMSTPVRVQDIERAAREAADGLSTYEAFWDPDGFVDGAKALLNEAPTVQAIRGFAASDRMKISLADARNIYPLLRPVPGKAEASLAGLLNPQWYE